MAFDLKLAVVAGLIVGAGLIILFALISPSLSIVDSEGRLMTMTGEVVCLPHKKIMWGLFGSVVTSECSLGFRTQDGKHFGFDKLYFEDKNNWLLGAQGSNEVFNVTGVVRPPDEDFRLLDIAGIIRVDSAVRADGTTSIYEAYGRHYNELSEILDEIRKTTGAGYGIGIDKGCDDIESLSDEKSSCILIVVEKDVPELSRKIPTHIEGYPVYVVVQPPLSSVPTTPALTEDKAIEIMKSDLRKRVGDDVLIFIYARDFRDPEINESPLPLIYYQQEDNMVLRINGTTDSIIDSCVPSLECFINNKKDVLDSVAGKLFYFIDGSYSGQEKSSPAYYYVDAMNGDILWSYVGEDIYPELAR